MKRTDLYEGDHLFYATGMGRWSRTYEAVVRSVEPTRMPHSGSKIGVAVTLIDHDNHQHEDMDGWRRQDFLPDGPLAKATVVMARHLHGPWEELRAAQLDRRERDRQAEVTRAAAEARTRAAVTELNQCLTPFGFPETFHRGDHDHVYLITATLVELLAGWRWAAEQNSDSQTGELVDTPWRAS